METTQQPLGDNVVLAGGKYAARVAIDIFTHCSDGPLIWFPLNWEYRFASPISYWEVKYSGRTFAQFELALDVAPIGYLLVAYWPELQRRWL